MTINNNYMNKPVTVKWINGLLIARLSIILIILAITITVIYSHPAKGFLTGFADTILKRNNIQNPYTNTDSATGELIGVFLLPFLSILLEYLFLLNKKRVGFWISLGFDFIFSLMIFKGLPLFPVVILILGLRKSTRMYFSPKNPDLPGDIPTIN